MSVGGILPAPGHAGLRCALAHAAQGLAHFGLHGGVVERVGAGFQGGVPVRGYLEEDGVAPDSRTETYAALRLEIANRRWAGVPFYLRAGKRLARRVTEVAVVFKQPPFLPFEDAATAGVGANTIVVRIQPDEGITMRLASKVPGTHLELRDVRMDFGYGASFNEDSPEAYERLILDALLGDAPLFPHQREVEADHGEHSPPPEAPTDGANDGGDEDARGPRSGRTCAQPVRSFVRPPRGSVARRPGSRLPRAPGTFGLISRG